MKSPKIIQVYSLHLKSLKDDFLNMCRIKKLMQLILLQFKKINHIMIYLPLIFIRFKTIHAVLLYFILQINNQ
ncbi:hypothetical protein DYD21_02080 [Rhodohalobacter sp. SW132]|nr:hypothetical protein DYD21_02080 [Rhodohalobacter sp. SW132]